MKQHQVLVDNYLCIGCGVCAKACAASNIKMIDHKATVLSNDCIMCGHCTAVCPKKAISISGYSDTSLMDIVAKTKLNPQEVLNTIRFRRSIRHFQDTPIPHDVILQMLEAGRLTHTAKNLQDVEFVVLDQDKDKVQEMAVKMFKRLKPLANIFSAMSRRNDIDEDFFFFKAPTVIVIVAKDRTNGILAAQNMEFVAEANELGVLYSGFFTMAANHSRKIKKAISLTKDKKVAMTLVIGYPDIKFLRAPQRQKLSVKYL